MPTSSLYTSQRKTSCCGCTMMNKVCLEAQATLPYHSKFDELCKWTPKPGHYTWNNSYSSSEASYWQNAAAIITVTASGKWGEGRERQVLVFIIFILFLPLSPLLFSELLLLSQSISLVALSLLWQETVTLLKLWVLGKIFYLSLSWHVPSHSQSHLHFFLQCQLYRNVYPTAL